MFKVLPEVLYALTESSLPRENIVCSIASILWLIASLLMLYFGEDCCPFMYERM